MSAEGSRPLRIEMVLPALVVGGMEVMVGTLARCLRDAGHDVAVTCIERAGALAEELRADGVPVEVVPTPGLRTNLSAPQLRDRLLQRRVDVVHSHSGSWLKAARAARAAGVDRVVHTVHGLPDRDQFHERLFMRLGARYTDVVVPVSSALRRHLIDRVGIPARQIRTIANGVDVERFRPADGPGPLRQALGLPPSTLIVGNVARLALVKNFPLLLAAFREVRAARSDVVLVLVGDGPMRPEIERLVAELGLGGAVHLLGERYDVPELYREFDVFVLSSTAEGTSMSILEAMATGLPVVATAVGGNPDLIAVGQCGILVPSGEVAPMAEALLSLLGDDARRTELGAAGRGRAVSTYAWEVVVSHYEALYRGRVAEPAPGAAAHV